MKKAIIGRKIGMTQIFDEKGNIIPVTAIQAGPCVVVQIKDMGKDGYSAVKMGFDDIKSKKVSKPVEGQFKKIKVAPKKVLKEFRFEEINLNVGDEVRVDSFEKGEFVDITGTTKGKGFAGVVKRYGYAIGPKAHGSRHHRSPGSIGASATPAKVAKGKRLPGRMGSDTNTVQNLEIVVVDIDKNMILVKGSVPGNKGAILEVKNAIKKN